MPELCAWQLSGFDLGFPTTSEISKQHVGCYCRTKGQAIARRILDAPFFLESSSVAVYLTAPRLREVDTGTIVTSILQPGLLAGGDDIKFGSFAAFPPPVCRPP